MPSSADDAGKQQLFTGVGFRSEPVQCPDCGWSGTAGQLRSLLANNLKIEVCFSCPACEDVIGIHAGLSDSEVIQELVRVRAELAVELHDDIRRSVPEPGGLSYEEVRKRINDIA